MKLFAMDLDGTLIDREGGIHPRDARAIASAMERGVIVTIATGRLTSGTHLIARTLGLTAPLVCADGGVVACAKTERLLSVSPMRTADVEALLLELGRAELGTFVFTHDTIHSCERGRAHHGYVRGWSPRITTHADVVNAHAWRLDGDHAVMVVGIGSPKAVQRFAAWAREAHPTLDAETFTFGPAGVVRVVADGVSKGAALAALAKELGVGQEHTAVIGDWLNDLSMFRWASRGYAMPHAPQSLKSIATRTLDDDACKQGAIAAAIEHWLSES